MKYKSFVKSDIQSLSMPVAEDLKEEFLLDKIKEQTLLLLLNLN